MNLWILTIANMLCIAAILSYLYKEFVVVKMGAISVALFGSVFSVISGFFFWIDHFSFYNVLIAQLIVELAILLLLFLKKGKINILFSYLSKRDTVVLFIILFAVLLTWTKFELFGANQDQGLYQTEALELYMGNYEVQHDFEEYSILETDKEREEYYHMLDEVWIGYYPLSDNDYIEYDGTMSEVSGMYHGVQTFPAMLALMGLLFGMTNMVHLQTIFYICCIIFIYYTLWEMNIITKSRVFYTAMFALSPLCLWISKGTYTEMFLCMMVCFYLLLLFEENEEKWLMCMPLLGFSFVHISYLAMWPGFWIANAVLYLYNRNKQYLYVNIVSSIGLFLGYYMMYKIAPIYFYLNVSRLYIENVITHNNIMIYFLIVALLSIVVASLMLNKKMEWLKSVLLQVQKSKWIIPFFLILALAFWLFWGFKMGYVLESDREDRVYYGNGLMAYTHLSIYASIMATGFVVLPCILGSLFVRAKKIVEDTKKYVLVLIFIYFIVFLSIFYVKEIHFYYYYSRYVLCTVPIVCLCAPLCINNWKKKVMIPIVVVTLISMLFFDSAIIKDKDDTIYEWEVLEDLKQTVEENSAIIISGQELQVVMGPNVRTVLDVAVYPMFEDTRQQVRLLQEKYENVYLLSETNDSPKEWNGGRLEVVYKDKYNSSRGQSLGWGVYPTDFNSIEKELVLYKVSLYELGDVVWFATEGRNAEDYVKVGLASAEGNFAWTTGEKLVMQFGVAQEVIGTPVRAEFEVQNVYNSLQEVEVYINNDLVDVVTLKGAGLLEFEFVVESEKIVVELVFPDAISPYELGLSEDARVLALALHKGVLTEMSTNVSK